MYVCVKTNNIAIPVFPWDPVYASWTFSLAKSNPRRRGMCREIGLGRAAALAQAYARLVPVRGYATCLGLLGVSDGRAALFSEKVRVGWGG